MRCCKSVGCKSRLPNRCKPTPVPSDNEVPCCKKSLQLKQENAVETPRKKCPEGKKCVCKSCCLSSCRAGVRQRCENCSEKIVSYLQKQCNDRCQIPQKKFIEPSWSFYKAVSFLKYCEENPARDFCTFLNFTGTSKCQVSKSKQKCQQVNKCCK